MILTVWQVLSGKVRSEETHQGHEGVSHMAIRGKSDGHRGKSKCQGPDAGASLLCLKRRRRVPLEQSE